MRRILMRSSQSDLVEPALHRRDPHGLIEAIVIREAARSQHRDSAARHAGSALRRQAAGLIVSDAARGIDFGIRFTYIYE
jgi:hypothetical protein